MARQSGTTRSDPTYDPAPDDKSTESDSDIDMEQANIDDGESSNNDPDPRINPPKSK